MLNCAQRTVNQSRLRLETGVRWSTGRNICCSYLYLVVEVILSWFSRNLWKVSLDSLYLIRASSFSSFSVCTL